MPVPSSSTIPLTAQNESPEFRWLLLCLRARFGTRDEARDLRKQLRASLNDQLDWARLMDLAEYHSIRPLVYQFFFNDAFENVPQHIHQKLSTFIRHNLVSTTLLASNLPKVVE